MLAGLVAGAAAFTLVKVLFGILAFYSRLGSDKNIRRRLDDLWDRLNTETFGMVAHVELSYLAAQFERALALPTRRAIFLFISVMLKNFFVMQLGLVLYTQIIMDGAIVWTHAFKELGNMEIYRYANPDILAVVVAIWAAALDLVAVFVTVRTMRVAARVYSIARLLSSVVIAIAVSIVFLVVVLLGLAATQSVLRLNGVWLPAHGREVLSTWFSRSSGLRGHALRTMVVLLTVTTTLVPLSYAIIATLVAVAHVMPERVRTLIRNTVFLISTGGQPVLEQVGDLCGVFAAVLAALVTMVKK